MSVLMEGRPASPLTAAPPPTPGAPTRPPGCHGSPLSAAAASTAWAPAGGAQLSDAGGRRLPAGWASVPSRAAAASDASYRAPGSTAAAGSPGTRRARGCSAAVRRSSGPWTTEVPAGSIVTSAALVRLGFAIQYSRARPPGSPCFPHGPAARNSWVATLRPGTPPRQGSSKRQPFDLPLRRHRSTSPPHRDRVPGQQHLPARTRCAAALCRTLLPFARGAAHSQSGAGTRGGPADATRCARSSEAGTRRAGRATPLVSARLRGNDCRGSAPGPRREGACLSLRRLSVTSLGASAYRVEGCGAPETFICIEYGGWVCTKTEDPSPPSASGSSSTRLVASPQTRHPEQEPPFVQAAPPPVPIPVGGPGGAFPVVTRTRGEPSPRALCPAGNLTRSRNEEPLPGPPPASWPG